MNHADAIATGRDESLFAGDIENTADVLREAITGARILAVGAAGSIGSNTIHTLAAFAPKAIHVVDQNENALAELVRQIRSAPTPFPVEDFRTLPLDYGSPATKALMAAEGPYDRILKFCGDQACAFGERSFFHSSDVRYEYCEAGSFSPLDCRAFSSSGLFFRFH